MIDINNNLKTKEEVRTDDISNNTQERKSSLPGYNEKGHRGFVKGNPGKPKGTTEYFAFRNFRKAFKQVVKELKSKGKLKNDFPEEYLKYVALRNIYSDKVLVSTQKKYIPDLSLDLGQGQKVIQIVRTGAEPKPVGDAKQCKCKLGQSEGKEKTDEKPNADPEPKQ